MKGPQSEQRVDPLIRAFLEERAETVALSAVSADEMAARLGPVVMRRWAGLQAPSFGYARLTRLPTVATVLGIVLIGGVLVLSMADQRVGGPSPSPTGSAPAVVPRALRAPWVGGPRSLNDVPSASGTLLTFTDSTLAMTHLGPEQEPAEFLTSAGGTADGSLRLTISGRCEGGAVGDYTWSLSDGGGRLTITAVSDPCATRRAAVMGDWFKVGCKNPQALCLGGLEPGTYASQNLAPRLKPGETWSPTYGAMTYTVPDGWANATDWVGSFSLVPASDYTLYSEDGPPQGRTHEIAVYARPGASDQTGECSGAERTDVPRTVAGLIGFVDGLRSVSASPPHRITIDGRDGRWIDVRIAPGWTGRCPGDTVPVVQLFRNPGAPALWSLELRGDARMRLVVLDVGRSDVVLIAVVSADPDRFDDLAAQSMSIIESIHFN